MFVEEKNYLWGEIFVEVVEPIKIKDVKRSVNRVVVNVLVRENVKVKIEIVEIVFWLSIINDQDNRMENVRTNKMKHVFNR